MRCGRTRTVYGGTWDAGIPKGWIWPVSESVGQVDCAQWLRVTDCLTLSAAEVDTIADDSGKETELGSINELAAAAAVCTLNGR